MTCSEDCDANLRIWLGNPRSLVSLANKQSGFFHFEKDENWRLKFQGTAINPDVVDDVAEWLGVGKLGEKGLCPPGSFKLATMETCMPWLGCQEMSDEVTVQNMFARGKRKKVYNATWRGHTVAYSNLSNTRYTPHFLRDVEMLRNMQPTSHVVQLALNCDFQHWPGSRIQWEAPPIPPPRSANTLYLEDKVDVTENKTNHILLVTIGKLG
uniref:Uncharacterized protein n=1 Tax=Branchiostoma floridae TaxID=7739 RepID=C3XZL7_BRAFL|eukprot:XP_002610528.1 hypothetical protein BRAFLDRAFT_65695 [Branchiostoma floridae]